jgi:hypothetical protein
MIFLSIFSAIDCHQCLVVFLLPIIVFILGSISANYKYVNSIGLIMPVTTRSKSHLIHHSLYEPPQVCLECSLVVGGASTPSVDPSTKYMSRESIVLSNDLISSSLIQCHPFVFYLIINVI